MDGNLNHVDLNQCIRIAPQPTIDDASVGVQSPTFHSHPIPSSSPTHSLTNAPSVVGGSSANDTESYSMDQVRANLELLQRKHSEKRKKAEENRHARLEVELPSDKQSAAELTEFGKNRPSTGLTPTLSSPQSSPSPTSFPRRMIDGIDLSNREALNELSLSTVQRLHDKLRDQILTEMQVELNESQTFDQVVKQGFQELELKKRQLSQHETLSADNSLPPSISTISSTSSRVPSHESINHISSGSFHDEALALPPSHPTHTRSSSSNSSIQSSPSPASAMNSSKPRHLSVAVPKEDFISPPPLSTHSHPHSTRHGGSNIHSTRSNHSGKQFVSPHPNIPQHHENSQASYVRQLLTSNARDSDHLHPGVKAIVDIISPKASPAAGAPSTRSSHAQSFRFGAEVANEGDSSVQASPLYASGTSSHRFDRFLGSDSLQHQQPQQQQLQYHQRTASNSSASSSTSTPSQAKQIIQQQSAPASVPGTSVNSAAVTPSSSIPFAALTRVRTPHDGFRQSFALHTSTESGAPISASHVIRTTSSPSTGSPPSGSDYYATPSPPSIAAVPQRPPPLHSTGSPMAGSFTSIASPVPIGGPPPSGKRRWSPLKERGRASHTPSPSSARLQQQLLSASPTPSSGVGSTLLFPAQPQHSASQPTLIYAVPVTPGSEMALPPGGEFFYAMPAPISATNVAATPFFAAPSGMRPPLSTTAAGSVGSFDWNVAPLTQAFTPTSSSPMLTSPSPPHHHSGTGGGGNRVKFSPVPPTQPRPQSESLARRSPAASPSLDQSAPPLERSKTAGHVPSGSALGATPTSAARMKRMKSVGAAIASMPSPQSAQERGIPSPHVSHPAKPLQLGNWTQMQNAAVQQQPPSINTSSSSSASFTARASPTANGKLFSSSSIAHAPHPSTARHHASSGSGQPRVSATRAAIDAQFVAGNNSASTIGTGSKSNKKKNNGKFHPGNAISNLKARRVADKEKVKSQKQQSKAASAEETNSNRTRLGVPILSLEAFNSHRSSGGLPSAIAEGDEVAAAALSARLASMGLGSGNSSVESSARSSGKKSHKSPQMGSRYFSSPRKNGAPDLSHLEIEEEASLAGMEQARTDSPIPYPPSNESRATTSDEEIEEEEHLRHGQHPNFRR